MSTKMDQVWARGILDNVRALILEVERLEDECQRLEDENYRLRNLKNQRPEVSEAILESKLGPRLVDQVEALDKS